MGPEHWTRSILTINKPGSPNRLVKLVERYCAEGFFVSSTMDSMREGTGLVLGRNGRVSYVHGFKEVEPWAGYI